MASWLIRVNIWKHCVVFLDKTINSHCVPLRPVGHLARKQTLPYLTKARHRNDVPNKAKCSD